MKQMIIQFICLFVAITIASIYLNSKKVEPKKIEIKGIENIVLKINNESNNLILSNNNTVKELIKLFPIEQETKSINNELIIELEKEVATNPKMLNKVSKGDVVLYQDKSIVVFLDDKNVNKEYTKLGKVLLLDKLDEIKENEIIKVIINKG